MKNILIYEKDKISLSFLRDFFKTYRSYTVTFHSNVTAVKNELKKNQPDILIIGSSCCLKRLGSSVKDCPSIAMISEDVTKGIKTAVSCGIENYLIKPFYKDDLKYKLSTLSNKTDHFKTLYQEKKDIEAISELTCILSSTLDPQEVLYLIVKKLSDLVPVTRCSILGIKTERHRIINVVSTFEDPKITHLKLDLKKYPEIKKAIMTKQPVIITNASKDPIMKDVKDMISRLGIKSIVVVPILFRSEVIGTLFLRTSRRGHLFTDREIKLCKAIASSAANALNNAFLFEEIKSERAELERLAITDFLTGIYNVRYLYHRLDNEFSRAKRYKSSLSCIMLDIDYFKRINDNYGHRTGDMVLREFASLIKDHTRKSDVFARYGGEEFIMIMPHTTKKGAIIEAERLRSIVRNHHFKGLKKNTRITISIGISSCPHKDIKTQDELITLADDALLKAKDGGRNMIVVH